MAFRPMNGRTSTPDKAANVVPMIQAARRTRTGLVACIASRSGSSTTARIAVPVRVHRKSAYRPATATTPTTVTISWA